jgi:hypothetical protein
MDSSNAAVRQSDPERPRSEVIPAAGARLKPGFFRAYGWVERCMFLAAALIWLGLSVLMAIFLLSYLADGAGLQFFPFGIFSIGVSIGVVHFCGFVLASFFCLLISFYFAAFALASAPEDRAARPISQG